MSSPPGNGQYANMNFSTTTTSRTCPVLSESRKAKQNNEFNSQEWRLLQSTKVCWSTHNLYLMVMEFSIQSRGISLHVARCTLHVALHIPDDPSKMNREPSSAANNEQAARRFFKRTGSYHDSKSFSKSWRSRNSC